jgi:hypothetical protein
VATVVGTPSIYQAPMPETVPTEELELTVFEDRVIPEVLWYQDTLNYSLVAQDHEAPLVFIIAGTGAAHDSAKARLMAAAFYQAGFHSIALPSPTHPNFIVPASTTGVPGRISQDGPDLYRVMRLAYEQVADRIEVSAFHLTGYSLGAWQAAFIAQLDEQEKVFGFETTSTNSSTTPSPNSTGSTITGTSSSWTTSFCIGRGWIANPARRPWRRSSDCRSACRRPA